LPAPRLAASILSLTFLIPILSCNRSSPPPREAAEPLPLPPPNVVYVLDTSASMKRGDLYNRLISELESRYTAHLPQGAHVAFMTFDDGTVKHFEFDVQNEQPIVLALQDLRALPPDGKYTNLTSAVYDAARWVDEITKSDPSRRSEVYIFTDGKHDPPPSAPEPDDWETVMRDEFAGGVIRRDAVGVYLVQLPGAEISIAEIPPEIQVIDAPIVSEQVTRSILRFEDVRFLLDQITVKAKPDGAIPDEDRAIEVKVDLEAAHVVPPGEPKDIGLRGDPNVILSPDEARFTHQGQKRELILRLRAEPPSGTKKLLVHVEPKSPELECDTLLTILVPIEIEITKPPLVSRLGHWVLTLPLWLLAVLLFLLAVIVICALLPKFKRQTMTVRDIEYRLRKRAGFCGYSVRLGPTNGIPLGGRRRTIAVLHPTRSGDVVLHRKAKSLKISGEEMQRSKMRLGSSAEIEYEGEKAEYSRE